MFADLPNEIILKILWYMPEPSLFQCLTNKNMSSVSQLFALLSSSSDVWKDLYAARWTTATKLDETGETKRNEGEETEGVKGGKQTDEEGETNQPNDNTPEDWKYLYKQKLRLEKEKEFQKISAEALKFQAKVALQLNRKREFDHAMQHLQNKKAKLTPLSVPQATPVYGWVPTHVQRHINQANAANPPLSPAQKEDIRKKAIEAATHGKFLQTCLEDVQKKTAFATQVLERYTELSQEIEQKKQHLGKQLKRLRS